jgi:hypothetical protein
VNKDKWLVIAIIFLGLSIIANGFLISKPIASSPGSVPQTVQTESRNDDILSLSEAAVFLNMSESKLAWLVENSKLIDGKGIPYYKVDQAITFSKATLSKWVIHSADNHFDY